MFLLDLSDIGDWMMFFFLSLFKRVNIAVIFIYDESFSFFARTSVIDPFDSFKLLFIIYLSLFPIEYLDRISLTSSFFPSLNFLHPRNSPCLR